MTVTDAQMKIAREQMTIDTKPVGDMPITAFVPREAIPTDVSGPLVDAEMGARMSRLMLESAWGALAEAKQGGSAKAIKKAQKSADEFFEMWLSVELCFAGLLLKRGKELKGRSMIAVK